MKREYGQLNPPAGWTQNSGREFRRSLGSAGRGRNPKRRGASAVSSSGERLDGRGLEQAADRDLDIERGADAADQPRRQQASARRVRRSCRRCRPSQAPASRQTDAHSTSSCGVRGSRRSAADRRLRRRQRPPVELAVRRQRQPIQQHERRRHHVVRQQRRQMRAAALPHRAPPRRPSPPHTPPDAATAAAAGARGGRGDVGGPRLVLKCILPASPAPSRRATTAACATPSCRFSAASISPGSMRKPRSFTCASARPRKSSTPSLPPARQVAGAVHPAARRPERIGHEPLRRQPRAPQIAPRQTQARNIQLARSHQPEQAADRHPARKPACSRSADRSEWTAAVVRADRRRR